MVHVPVNEHAGAMGAALGPLITDLATVQGHLRDGLASLPREGWDALTPAAPWTVRHQVRHLAQGEELAGLAATDPDAFAAHLADLLGDVEAVAAATTAPDREDPTVLLERWWSAATALRAALAEGPADRRIGWVTGPMSTSSFATARVMETFAHGHDIAEALGWDLDLRAALPHVAHLGLATRTFAFANRGLAPPAAAVRVELTGPAGEAWSWGPEDAADRVTGPALDFCLVVTQRRHVDDTALSASGPSAATWLRIAQCFAGPPTEPPPPRASGDC
jgi:uncharacterized protein (TIGR03084 family)